MLPGRRPTRTSRRASPRSTAGPWTTGSTRPSPASGSRRRRSPDRPRSSRGASRPAPPSPASSSPTRTCFSSTSRRTTWTCRAIEWLEQAVRHRRGALLVASHDRAFLDATVTRVWELRDRRLSAFRGDYSSYARQREERDARLRRDAESREIEIAKEQALVQTYRSQRKHGKMHEHEARLARLDRISTPREGPALRLDRALGSPPPRSGDVALRLDDLVIGHPGGPDVARTVRLEATRGERIGVVGPNGAGKKG